VSHHHLEAGMYAAAIVSLILVWLFGRHVFRAVWWIFIAGILGIIGLLVLGAMLPDQPKPKAAAVTPTARPKLLDTVSTNLLRPVAHQRQHQHCSNTVSTKARSPKEAESK